MPGARDVVSKFEEDSGSRRSMLMVRQFAVAMMVVVVCGNSELRSRWRWMSGYQILSGWTGFTKLLGLGLGAKAAMLQVV